MFSSKVLLYLGVAIILVIQLLYFGLGTFQTHSKHFICFNTSSEDFVRQRLQESEVMWNNSVQERHNLETANPVVLHQPMENDKFMLLWDFFYPVYNCPHFKQRIGRAGDGGKWICGLSVLAESSKPCIVYSYGIGGDTSFEQDILTSTNCTVRAFDHTISSSDVNLPEQYPGRVSFDEIGLGIVDDQQSKTRTLKTEMDLRNDSFIDVMKVDIEGAEFETFRKILKDFEHRIPIGQLLIELHLVALPDGKMFEKFKKWWENLEKAGFRAFNSEPNLFGGKYYYEFSFLNVKIGHVILHAKA